MMKQGKLVILCLSIIIILLLTGCKNDDQPPTTAKINPDNSQNIPGWFYSNQLYGNRYIYLHLPENFDLNSGKTYPTIYLLDANWYFDGSHWRMPGGGIKALTNGLVIRDSIPEAILVGIGNLNEYNNQMRGNDFHSPNTPKFLRFIANELIPRVDSLYNLGASTADDRVLIGHSSGGYFSTYALFNNDSIGSDAINNYISLSILQAEHANINFEEEQFYAKNGFDRDLNLKLFMGVGSDEEERFLIAYDTLKKNLTSRNYKGFQIEGNIYQGHDHSSYITSGVRDGLTFIFRD